MLNLIEGGKVSSGSTNSDRRFSCANCVYVQPLQTIVKGEVKLTSNSENFTMSATSARIHFEAGKPVQVKTTSAIHLQHPPEVAIKSFCG